MQMVLTGQTLSAQEAKDYKIVTKIVSGDALPAAIEIA